MGNRQNKMTKEPEMISTVSGHRLIMITADDCGACTFMKKRHLPILKKTLDARPDVRFIHINMPMMRLEKLIPSSPVPLPNVIKEYVTTERVHLPCILMCPMNLWASHETTKKDLDMYPFSPTTDAASILKWMTGLLDSSKYTTIVSEDFDEEDQKPVTDTPKKISPAPAVSQPIPIKTRSTVSRARIATGPSAPVINKKPKSVVNRYPPSKPVAKTTKPVAKPPVEAEPAVLLYSRRGRKNYYG